MPRILETVRALLLAHDFAAYRAVIDQAQTSDAYQGYGFDDQLVNALAACVSQTRSVDEATAAWLEQAPEESAALMARATFLQARGSWARGQGAAGSVTAQGWRDMHESYRAAARLWARAAQQLERPAHALAQMGCVAWIGG